MSMRRKATLPQSDFAILGIDDSPRLPVRMSENFYLKFVYWLLKKHKALNY